MARFRKRAARRRPLRRRRRFGRRRFGRRTLARTLRRVPVQNKMGVHWFKRAITWGEDTTVSSNFAWSNPANGGGLVTTGSLLTFQIAASSTPGLMSSIAFCYTPSIANQISLTDWTNLFDAYQIRKVVFKLTPYSNVINAETNSTGSSVILHTVIDHDDGTIPAGGETGVDSLKKYISYRQQRLITSSRKPWTRVLRGRPSIYVNNEAGAAVNAMEGRNNAWIDMAQTTIPYYALKGIFEAPCFSTSASTLVMRAETTYYFKFKGVR